jgi:hypothetical protein
VVAPVVAAAISALALRRADQTRKELGVVKHDVGHVRGDVETVRADIGTLAENVNGKMAQLIDVTEKAAFGQGVQVGVAAGVASTKPEQAVVPPLAVPELPAVAPTVPPSLQNRRKEDKDQKVPPEHDPSTHL